MTKMRSQNFWLGIQQVWMNESISNMISFAYIIPDFSRFQRRTLIIWYYKTTTCKQATYGMHIISTGAAWPVGVHWDVFQPLLNEKRAVAHTDAAYGVAPDNAAAERRKRKKQKMTYFFPTFCIQHGQPLQMIKRDSERVEINICDHDKSYETTTSWGW
mgnify:FL=1